jgi:hypothetical protein
MSAAPKTVTAYLDGVAEPYRADARELHRLIRATVPELRPFVASGMIGYGAYHYRYATGREGDTFVVGLAGRKNGLALHVTLAVNGAYLTESFADRVGKADVGKSCIRFRRLSDLDQETIVALLRSAGKAAAEQHAK